MHIPRGRFGREGLQDTFLFSQRRSLPRELLFWGVAIVVGLVVGYAMAGLRVAIAAIERIGFQAEGDRLVSATSGLTQLNIVLVPVCGGIVVAGLLWLGSRWNEGIPYRMGGIQDVIYARRHVIDQQHSKVDAAHMRLSLKDAFLTWLMAIVSLGTGASAGREGPAVHVGAALSGNVARWLNFNAGRVRALLGCGAAAAVAASFNAPLAGVLFAHEVVLGKYRTADIGPVAMASVTAALVTRLTFGDESVFVAPVIGDVGLVEFMATPFIGLLAAGFAIVLIRSWVIAPKLGTAFADNIKMPTWVLPPLAGLIIGLFALAFPQVLGVGYEATAAAIAGGYSPQFMLILAVAKLAATAICLGGRFGGGVFSSSIVCGAMMGGVFGGLVGLMTGDVEMAKVFFTVVGMGALSGAVLGAPISTTLIVFELTRSYETAAAVLVAVSLATVIVQAVAGGSIFEKQLKSARG